MKHENIETTQATTVKNATKNTTTETPATPTTVDAKDLATARKFWTAENKRSDKAIENWVVVGSVLKSVKEAFNGNTKKYGPWAVKMFPGMDTSSRSQAIILFTHKTEILAWYNGKDQKLKTTHPVRLIALFKKAMNVKSITQDELIYKTDADKAKDKDKEAGKNEMGVGGHIETYRLTVNKLIKAIEAGNVPAPMIAELNTIHHTLSDALRPEEVKTAVNA